MKDILATTDNVADVDWSVEDTQIEYKFEVDKDKAMRLGIPNAQVVQNLRAALSGMSVGVLHRPLPSSRLGLCFNCPKQKKQASKMY